MIPRISSGLNITLPSLFSFWLCIFHLHYNHYNALGRYGSSWEAIIYGEKKIVKSS